MSFIHRWLLPAAALLTIAQAQQCYYPNGQLAFGQVPCETSGAASSCCGISSFCLTNGLCFEGGIVSRGGCTDKTWGSPACAQYCTKVDKDTESAITPCTSGESSNTFVCGTNTTGCQTDSNTFTLDGDTSLVLRPNQIAALVGSAVSTASNAACSSPAIPDGYVSSGALAGVAVGIAIPLFMALAIMFVLLRKEKRRYSKPKLMYKLPDDVRRQEDFEFKPPPTVGHAPAFASDRSSNGSRNSNAGSHTAAASTMASRRGSLGTFTSTARPGHSMTFIERYEAMKKSSQRSSPREVHSPRQTSATPSPMHELESPSREAPRYELSEQRMSA